MTVVVRTSALCCLAFSLRSRFKPFIFFFSLEGTGLQESNDWVSAQVRTHFNTCRVICVELVLQHMTSLLGNQVEKLLCNLPSIVVAVEWLLCAERIHQLKLGVRDLIAFIYEILTVLAKHGFQFDQLIERTTFDPLSLDVPASGKAFVQRGK